MNGRHFLVENVLYIWIALLEAFGVQILLSGFRIMINCLRLSRFNPETVAWGLLTHYQLIMPKLWQRR